MASFIGQCPSKRRCRSGKLKLMNRNKLLKVTAVAAVSIVAGGAFLFARTPAGSASAEPVSPRSLYSQNCARCHGANGKAQTRLGRKLEADDISGGMSTEKIIRTVTNGKGEMPSFRKKLTAAQIRQIADYVHSL